MSVVVERKSLRYMEAGNRVISAPYCLSEYSLVKKREKGRLLSEERVVQGDRVQRTQQMEVGSHEKDFIR